MKCNTKTSPEEQLKLAKEGMIRQVEAAEAVKNDYTHLKEDFYISQGDPRETMIVTNAKTQTDGQAPQNDLLDEMEDTKVMYVTYDDESEREDHGVGQEQMAVIDEDLCNDRDDEPMDDERYFHKLLEEDEQQMEMEKAQVRREVEKKEEECRELAEDIQEMNRILQRYPHRHLEKLHKGRTCKLIVHS
ncbi:unnamed protein product, partial [Cylicostephanus goldi]